MATKRAGYISQRASIGFGGLRDRIREAFEWDVREDQESSSRRCSARGPSSWRRGTSTNRRMQAPRRRLDEELSQVAGSRHVLAHVKRRLASHLWASAKGVGWWRMNCACCVGWAAYIGSNRFRVLCSICSRLQLAGLNQCMQQEERYYMYLMKSTSSTMFLGIP